MAKITIEVEGQEPRVMDSDTYFVFADGVGATWKGVDTHLSKMLEIYSDFIMKKRLEEIYGDSK